jgi:tetratricopeptide (TPR) repeat protein
MYAGEFRMALHHLNTSFQISSHHPNWFTTTEVLAHFFLDELDAAQRAAERALQRFPDFPHAHINLASVYAARGMDAKANKVAEKFLASQPLFSVRHYAKSQIFRDPAHARTWTDCMLRSGLAA